MKKISDFMSGAIDLHVHAAPDLHKRPLDEIEIARAALNLGMKAVLFKSHYTINADRMWYVSKAVPEIHCFGGVTLNYTVGGLNPYAVEACIKFGGKEVWMPTFHSAHHVKHADTVYGGHKIPGGVKEPKVGISVLTSKGELAPEVVEILHLIAEADIILGTSHLYPEEISVLVSEAKGIGVKKILVTHPFHFPLSLEQQVELSRKGAYMEYCFVYFKFGEISIDELANAIKRVGAERCVLATDDATVYTQPAYGLRTFVQSLLERGIGEKEVEKMVKEQPMKLLNLKDETS